MILSLVSVSVFGQSPAPFTSTPLIDTGDFSIILLEGMSRLLDREIEKSVNNRAEFWHVDFSSPEAYCRSVDPNRERFARIIGVVDERIPEINMEFMSSTSIPAMVAQNEFFNTFAVRWNVLGNIHGEGLLIQPKGVVKNRVVVIPDADQVPEVLIGTYPGLAPEMQYARHLAENGSQVIIPTIINRSCELSGSARLNNFTNQPHREWIYRQAYTFGRHVIGYEVQKILAAIDWFDQENAAHPLPIGVIGWGEGGLLGFYSAALDTRIDAALISGYFEKRDSLWKEPIYRNLHGLLREFGDAEIAGMIIPRDIVIEYSGHPEITGPPEVNADMSRVRNVAAPGRISTPPFTVVKDEVERAMILAGPFKASIRFLHDNEKATGPVSQVSLLTFLQQMNPKTKKLVRPGMIPAELRDGFDPNERLHSQIKELELHIQPYIEISRHVRNDFFWNNMKISTPETWEKETRKYQEYFRENVTGRINESRTELNPRSRQIYDKPRWIGYEITLDVLPDLFTWGYLLLPKDLKPGEKRPVIVVMHGGGGVPSVVLDPGTYNALAVQLVERGYIVFAPHFPWLTRDGFRTLQRKANPAGLTYFSLMIPQHDGLLDWLTSLPFVDSEKIGFYGLSWGGKVAMRIPALLDRYSLVICSGDFNEWIWKLASIDLLTTYMFAVAYEIFDFNLGMTFNYGEMAALIAPRAFMVERGHDDGVGIDEWVAFEYAKVNRLYNKLNIPHMTEIEYFDGGHRINSVGTLKFIERHFGLP